MHPATWFKVEFPDSKVVTFRPSALQPLDDNGKPLASYTVKPSISKSKEKSPALHAMRHPTGESSFPLAAANSLTALSCSEGAKEY